MYYGAIKEVDIADGPGVRVSLFVSGCRNHCEGCFQPETWDFRYGQEFTPAAEQQVLDALRPHYITGLTILGGEPFEPENQGPVLALLEKARALCPEKSFWAFSGYTYDGELAPGGAKHTEHTDRILALLDVLVDGRFIQAQRDLSLRFRGSRNQRLIDLKRTRETGTVTLWDGR